VIPRNRMFAILGTLSVATVAVASGVSPHTAWRALVVYTNSTDSVYTGSLESGVNMYSGYFAALFDGINQVYEDSEMETRGQIAGVIWDKVYNRNYDSISIQGGCVNYFDAHYGQNGMARHKALLNKYAADVLILVHQSANPSGCTQLLSAHVSQGYAAIWIKDPRDVWVAAHEVGHIFDANHCNGHRVTLDMYGNEIAGALPNMMPAANSIDSISGNYVDSVVERETTQLNRGFHTTMSYNNGDGCEAKSTPGPGLYDMSYKWHNDGLTTWLHRFYHQGQIGDTTGWAGVFSNPALSWYDPPSNTYHTYGHDSVRYSRTIRYMHTDSIGYRDTVAYYRNAVAIHELNNDTIINFKKSPDSLVILSSMSIEPNTADTQWIYAHFVAKRKVRIQPGFRVSGGGTLKVTVGGAPSMLAKRASTRHYAETEKNIEGVISPELRVRYEPGSQAVVFSLTPILGTGIGVSVFDLVGRRKKGQIAFNSDGSSSQKHLSVRDLPNGVYIMRVTVGRYSLQKQFIKW